MNGLVSFFRDRKQGVTRELTLRVGQAPALSLLVYGSQPVKSAALEDRQVSEKDFAPSFQEIRAALAHSAGGGVIVTVEGAVQKAVKVEAVASDGYIPPDNFVLLVPGASPRLLPLGGEVELSPGSHLLVPADRASEERLGSFVAYLQSLPLDLELLVLDALRRPSLDARLLEVETRVLGETDADRRARSRWARGLHAAGSWFNRRLPWGPVLGVFLLVALAINAVWTRHLLAVMKKGPAPKALTSHGQCLPEARR